MAHAKFRYADHPHARILRIDTTKARALPGVVAVVTQEHASMISTACTITRVRTVLPCMHFRKKSPRIWK